MSNYYIKDELRELNAYVRDNDGIKVIKEGDDITVVNDSEVAPDFTRHVTVDVNQDNVPEEVPGEQL